MAKGGLGEFDLIARLTADLPRAGDVAEGVGDDAAVLNWRAGDDVVATCDALVEGRHFRRELATAEQIGRRALAVNLSDIAAMGAEPRFALVSLILPPDTDPGWLDGLYRGLRAEAVAFGVSIVGGNIAATAGPLVVDITLLGRVAQGKAILRSGARAGDRICVTGSVGSAAAGLLALLEPPATDGLDPVLGEAVLKTREAQLAPRPRVHEGLALGASGVVTAMVDISDGLAADLGHVCERSQTGAMVEAAALPISAEAVAVARLYEREAMELALYGGDDYELLFTVQPDGVDRALAAVATTGGTATPIGWVLEAGQGMRLRQGDGTEARLEARGWDHLRAQPH